MLVAMGTERNGPRTRLGHVHWLGGGSGAGKSTVARRIADRHGLVLYSTDDAMAEHARRSTRQDSPMLSEFLATDMDERWVRRTPQVMLDTFHWFRGEGFDLIVADLLRLPRTPVLVEGFRLLPHLVRPLLDPPRHAVWLLPTPEFRRGALTSRGSLWTIAGRTSAPDQALCNLLERDRLFTERLRAETARLALPAIEVDTTTTEDDLVRRTSEALGF
jgi:hypothetical protein